jgi:hypothetical protein
LYFLNLHILVCFIFILFYSKICDFVLIKEGNLRLHNSRMLSSKSSSPIKKMEPSVRFWCNYSV